MKIKFLILLLSAITVYSFPKEKEKILINDSLKYLCFEIIDNEAHYIGLGFRNITNNHATDFSAHYGRIYKNKWGYNLHQTMANLNYLYFFPNYNAYFGVGGKAILYFSKNNYVPVELSPNLILGFLTKIAEDNIFIELRFNFLRFIKILSNYDDFDYDKSQKKAYLRDHFLSVKFGAYF